MNIKNWGQYSIVWQKLLSTFFAKFESVAKGNTVTCSSGPLMLESQQTYKGKNIKFMSEHHHNQNMPVFKFKPEFRFLKINSKLFPV